MGKHITFINFVDKGALEPAPQSPWVMYISRGGGIPGKGNILMSWKALDTVVVTRTAKRVGVGAAMWDKACDVKPSSDGEEPLEVKRPQVSLNEGGIVWEDDDTLQYNCLYAHRRRGRSQALSV